MNLILLDDVLLTPDEYVQDIYSNEFVDIYDGQNLFKNIQPRDFDDEFAQAAMDFVGNDYEVAWNFVRKSPKGQEEPNFIHTDEMMGDLTAILYLSREYPDDDGTTIYDAEKKRVCTIYAKYNRMFIFDSTLPHSRNIFENFGSGESSRLIQVIFLKKKDERD